MKRPNFGKPPPGYIAGLGRGATGFTTRSDIGPARLAVGNPEESLLGYERMTGIPVGGDTPAPQQDFSDANYNSWSGYEGSLFANTAYDNEDREADDILENVDKYLDGRRSEKRKKIMTEQLKEVEDAAPKYQEQFADLKRQLANVSKEEWESIPDNPYLGGKRAKAQRYTATPDNLIDAARLDGESINFIDPDSASVDTSITGSHIPQTPMTNLSELGEARVLNLGLKLDKMSNSVMGTSVVNKSGYLTDLNALKLNSVSEINDIKKAKLLMKSVRKNNPDSPYGWISSARIEELDGKIESARQIIAQACDKFPLNEDVWVEAARLCPPSDARVILVKALTNMPKSKKLWMAMASLEKDNKMKIRTLRRALEYISNDVELWKAAIELEEPEEAKSLLYKAIECVPYNTSIWIALAKLENYQNARKVLNNACKKIPTDHTIWVHAAKLEEAEGNFELVPKLLRKGIKNLEKNVKITREQWLKEAYDAEMSASIVTAKAIIHETKNIGIDDIEDAEENKRIWLETGENFLDKGAIECSRAMIECACKVMPKDPSVWLKAIDLEKKYGNNSTLGAILKQALEACDDIELFFLMNAKHLWKQEKKIEEAIKTLQDGLHNLENEEELYLALVKLYREKRMYDEARQLLIKGRQKCDSNRIWMQSAQIEREVGNPDQAKLIIKTAIEKYPTFYKLYLIYSTLESDEENYDKAREIYEDSVKKCKPNPHLWICYAKMEQSLENYSKARTILQKGRIKLPKNDLIWIESIYLEIRAENIKVATHLCSKALQACPESGRLWSLAIELEPIKQRKSKALQAIKACEQDPYVAISLAKQFWKEKKYDKTQRWLKRATGLNTDLGDAWGYLYKFELENGNEESQKEVLNDCINSEPHHGELWCSISKQVCNWRLTTEEILRTVITLIQI